MPRPKMIINEWARDWSIPQVAINELLFRMTDQPTPGPVKAGSEAEVQQAIRLKASTLGMRLWRNNVGACKDETGRFIRFGLANESAKINVHFKSADLIGITPHKVTSEDVGYTHGIFTSIEVKAPGWKFTGTDREKAQTQWAQLVTMFGGRAMFATGPEVL